MQQPERPFYHPWEIVKALSVLVLVGVLAYKMWETPIELTVDFPVLLSLLLALFSVGLASLFYFKATQASNAFYDNTHKFTREIAQLLVKIESGFGEKLRHIDEGYTAMRDYLQNTPGSQSSDIEETKKKVEAEKEEIRELLEERNQVIRSLVERSELEREEKDRVLSELSEKEQELENAHEQLNKMNKRLFMERLRRRQPTDHESQGGLAMYTKGYVIPRLGEHVVTKAPRQILKRRFNDLSNELPRPYLDDLEAEGYFSDGLTAEGLNWLRALAKQGES
ncbi:hypothetical protein HFP89_02375 [Wenzhouxiangella sp. XN79A]|uniref:hypothetical protein n=1 Tax=Wenzhouxiangella sp. XN79A TaxID=2724193 RepID=UPI00144A77B2|nr:hypothetical protein [Wenzhouxiangella sp. XN79A]NKI34011.1 hypothetical protein [Wenzhouxiangella sp. XN79A]